MNQLGHDLETFDQARGRPIDQIGVNQMDSLLLNGGNGFPLDPLLSCFLKSPPSFHGGDNDHIGLSPNDLKADPRVVDSSSEVMLTSRKADDIVMNRVSVYAHDRLNVDLRKTRGRFSIRQPGPDPPLMQST
jgi:hypothetical protein